MASTSERRALVRASGVVGALSLVCATSAHAGMTPTSHSALLTGTAGDISDQFIAASVGSGAALEGGTGFLTHSEFGDSLTIEMVGDIDMPIQPGDRIEVTFEIFSDWNFGQMELLDFYASADAGGDRGIGDVFGEWEDTPEDLQAFETLAGSFETTAFISGAPDGTFVVALEFGFESDSNALSPLTGNFAQVEVGLGLRVIPAPATASVVLFGAMAGIRRRR